MNDLSPMLHQDLSDAPQLGGDRRPVPCEIHEGVLCIRDFFGNPVCPECMAHAEDLIRLRKLAVCPKCDEPNYLAAHINNGRVMWVWCDACDNWIWERHGLLGFDYDADPDVYLAADGRFEAY